MPLLEDEEITTRAELRSTFRLVGVTTKLSPPEVTAVEEAAKQRGQTRGEFVRCVVLAELSRKSDVLVPQPELTEIIGLRLMLANLLRPLVTGEKLTPEKFEAILAEVRRSKLEIATQLLQQVGGQ